MKNLGSVKPGGGKPFAGAAGFCAATKRAISAASRVLMLAILAAVMAGAAQAERWSNPYVSLSFPSDGSCIAGPYANATSTQVQAEWRAFNTDTDPGRALQFVAWSETSADIRATGSVVTNAPTGQLPLQQTVVSATTNDLVSGRDVYYGLYDGWASGSVWSRPNAPYNAPDETGPADAAIASYTKLDMTTDPDCVATPPGFSATFTPDSIATGGVSTLVFTIDNSGAASPASALDFTLNLPAGVTPVTPYNVSSTCMGGILSTSFFSFSYSGGQVLPRATCTVSVEVTASAAGSFNAVTGNLTSSLGNSGTASDRLSVTARTVTLSVSTTSSSEGDGSVVLTATQSSPAAQATTVNLAYSGTATGSGVDYTGPASITIPANATTQTAQISFVDDAIDEDDETIRIDISTISGGNGASENGVQQQTITLTDNDPEPSLRVENSSVLEAGGVLSFPVNLSAASGRTITVDYASGDYASGGAMASAGTDYTAASGTLTFNPGETSKNINVTLIDDGVVERSEMLSMTLSSATNATISRDLAIGTIINDDSATLSVADVQNQEGTGLTFTLTLSAPVDADVRYHARTTDGTAIAGDDYTALPIGFQGAISAGVQTVSLPVTINDDGVPEPDETFTVTLFALNNAGRAVTLGDASATGTILNDDQYPDVTLSASPTTISENGGTSTLTAALSATYSKDVTVDLAYSNANVTGPASIVVPSGSLTATASVTAVDNALDEPDRTVEVSVDSVTNGVEDGVQAVTLTLTDDDAAPSLSIADVTLTEGTSGTKAMTFTASLSAASARSVTVDYATSGGTASANVDFDTASGTLTFTPGQTQQTFDVTINGENRVELNETFTVTLSSPTNSTIADATAIGTILNDDTATISIADGQRFEGDTTDNSLNLLVSMSAPVDVGVSLTVTTADGTATAPADYYAVSAAPYSIADGQMGRFIPVSTKADTVFEPDETFTVTLADLDASGRAVTFSDDTATVTIRNDDAAPEVTLSASPTTIAENAGTSTLTATLSSTSTEDVTVSLAYSNANATGPASIVVPAGSLTATGTVTAVDNAIDEPDRTVEISVDSVTNGTESGTQAVTLTLTDDEGSPSLSIADVSLNEGASGTSVMTFTATLSAASARTVTVDYVTSDGTATAGADYTAASGMLTFTPGQTQQTFDVTVSGDNVVELTETFTVTLSNAANATISDDSAAGTITNDDSATLTLADSGLYETEADQPVSLRATLSAPVDVSVRFEASTADGTATAPSDYDAVVDRPWSINTGLTTLDLVFTVKGDTAFEPNEAFTVLLANLTASGRDVTFADASATVRILNNDSAPDVTLSASPTTISENAGTSTLTATLSSTSTEDVTVSLAYSNANAAGPASIVVPAGSLTATGTVTAVDNAIDEPDRTVEVSVDSVINGTENGTQAVTLTLTDDEDAPSLSIADASLAEGGSGTRVLTFTASLSAASGQTVSVDYATTDGTAVAGSDYTAASGTLTFTPGQTQQSFDVTVSGDSLVELDETFTVTLSSASNATIADASATGTITNDDALPEVSLFTSPKTITENGGTSTLTAALSGTSSLDVTVALAYSNATVTGPASIVVPAGRLTAQVTVTAVDNSVDEPDRTVEVSVDSVTNGAEDGVQAVTLTLTDDDGAPNLSIADAAISEGASGTGVMTFTVTLSVASGQTVTVEYATADGTAIAGSDYTAASGTLTFTPGQTRQTFDVMVSGDTVAELDEAFTVTLSSATNASINGASATGTVTNDDAAPEVTLSASPTTIAENGGVSTLTATLSVASSQDVTVALAYSNTNATSPASIVVPAGSLTATASVTAVDNALDEADRTVDVSVDSVTNGTESGVQAVTLTLTDDDDAPSLSIADASLTEGASGTSVMTFTASLSAVSGRTVTVDYATSDGTAIAGSDYTAASGTLTFTPGQTQQTFGVTVSGDNVTEPTEAFTVTLASATSATIADGSATGTITNDDAMPGVTLAAAPTTLAENGGTSTLTATLSAPSSQDVSVSLGYPNGNVTGPASIVVPAGSLTATASVTAVDNALDEPDRTVDVSVDSVTNGTENGTQAVTLTLTDDDGAPSLSIADASLTEGASGTSAMTFTVSLSAASGQTVRVDYATADGTAAAGSDYTAASGTLTFTPGQTQQTFDVTIAGDRILELDEAFTVSLSSATNAVLGNDTATGTITNDDAVPNVTLSAAPTTIPENGGVSTLTATLSAASSQDVTVALAYSNANATGPASIVVPAGSLTATGTATAVDNAIDEPDRTVEVSVDSVTNGTENGTQAVTLTLTDDEEAPSLSIADVSMNEGASGTSVMTFTASLSAASGQPVTVDYATADGTAVAGSDYTAASGTLTFTPGQIQQSFDVTVSGDNVVELTEAFSVTLSNAVNATILTAGASGTIANDDAATVSIADVTQAEGDTATTAFEFTVTLSNPIDTAISVDTATLDDSATTADGDYTASAGQLDFPAGIVSETFTVQVNGDTRFETSESFLAKLTNLQANGRNVTIADASGRGTIEDDDSAPTISVANATIDEADGAAVIAVTLGAASGQPVTFFWSTKDGSAVASDDYTAFSDKAEVIPAGQTRLDVAVPINDDSLEEIAETFKLSLSGVSGAIVATGEAVVTINASDLKSPTVALSSSVPGRVSGMFEVAVDFSESVTGFEISDVALVNAVAGNLAGSGASYTVEITPSADGPVSVELPAGAAQDRVGNASTGSNVLSRQADGKSPTVVLSTSAPDIVSGTFQVVIEFSEDVSGLELRDFALLNAAAADLSGSGARYTVEVTPAANGAVTIALPAASSEDMAGNANTASNTLTRQADGTAPELAIVLPDTKVLGAFTASFTFSEDVTGFEPADISVTNGAVSAFAGSGADYTALITPATVGMVEVHVKDGAGADAAGNMSLASTARLEAEASANEVTLVLDSSVGDPGTVFATSTLTNPGSAPLGFDVTADVPWIDFDPVSGDVPSSGSIDLTISLNEKAYALDAGDYVGTITVTTGGSVLMQIPVSLSVEARFGEITLVATTPSRSFGQASFNYTSEIEEFDGLTLNASSGRASASAAGIMRGQYAITQSLPAGWKLNSISCVGDADAGSTFDVQTGRAVIDLDPDENLVCTFENVRDEQMVRMATQRAIRNFMLRRADVIISSAPDLSRRFNERQSQERGGMSANITGSGVYQMNFNVSLAGARNAATAAEAASGARYDHADTPFLDGLDIWLAAEMSGIRDDRAGERTSTDFAMGQIGVDYALNENLIIGALGQYDWMDDKAREIFVEAGAVRGAEVQGNGWMAGPYMAWRIRDTLTFDALALYGQSDNSVNPLGLYSDDFETDRYMLRANLTGEFSAGPWTLRPQAGITHFGESQKGYTDRLGISIPGQDISLGRLRAGPELAWRGETDGGGWLQVSGAIDAIWDYDSADLLMESGQLTGGSGDLRADARVAFAAQTRWGPQLRFEFGLAGLGVGDFRAQSARFELRVPFGVASGPGGAIPMGAGGFGLSAQCDIPGGGLHTAFANQSGCNNGLANPAVH